jgi:uncharacterized protein
MLIFNKIKKFSLYLLAICFFLFTYLNTGAQNTAAKFKVIAFFSVKSEEAHLSFVHEANRWFPRLAAKYNFVYDSTSDWNNLNTDFLSHYALVIFLDTRPEDPVQREVFRKYMENGGAWMGFHFAGFALTPSEVPQNWDWYHLRFLGSGSWLSNTWRPTSAILRVEDSRHPVTKNLPVTFKASANEWYRWTNDLRKNPDIKILLSIDSTSFPLGTGPKPEEIWHSGYYPVVWTNKNYHMVYFNMGHNDLDYENKTNKQLSFTFENEIQNKLITDAVFWLVSFNKSTPGPAR